MTGKKSVPKKIQSVELSDAPYLNSGSKKNALSPLIQAREPRHSFTFRYKE
jgi:hypothetical protein